MIALLGGLALIVILLALGMCRISQRADTNLQHMGRYQARHVLKRGLK